MKHAAFAPLLVAGIVLAAVSRPAGAQAGTGFHFGLAGGETVPVSATRDELKSGWNGGAIVAFGIPFAPVSLRVEGRYDRMNRNASSGISGGARVTSGIASAVVVPASMIVVKPYFLGGGGLYNVELVTDTASGSASDTQRRFGWSAGAGVAFSIRGATVFVEGRYHRISTSGRAMTLVPVSVGLMF